MRCSGRNAYLAAVVWVAGWLAPVDATAQENVNVLGLPPKAVAASGKLVICGGGWLPESVYQEFIAHAGGRKARLVHIPTAWPVEDSAAYRRVYNGWLDYDVASFEFVHTNSRKYADTDRFIRPLENATGVWIGGGAQGRLADIYGGTKVEAALKRLLERGGVIGGTSAGASIMSKTMIRTGDHTEAEMGEGLGFLSRVVVDQHFSQRGRHTRLLGVMQDHPDLLAMGLDEGAAVLVHGNRLRVLSGEGVTIGATRAGGRMTLLYHLKSGEEADVSQVTMDGKSGDLSLTMRSKPSPKQK